MRKIQGLLTKRSGWLLALALVVGLIAAWCWLVFGRSVESSELDAANFLLRVLIYSGICFPAILLLGSVAKALHRLLRWLFSWRIIKRGLIGLAGLCVLIVLFYAEENWRGRHTWEKFKKEWEAKGEQFDFSSFVPPPVPDDQNFALTPIVASCYGQVLDHQGQRLKPENTNVVNRLEMAVYRVGIPASTNMSLDLWRQSRFTDLEAWQDHYRTMSLTNEVMVEAPGVREAFARRYGLTLVATNVATNTINVTSLATNEFPVAAQPRSPAAEVLLALSKYDSAIEELCQASRLPYARFPLQYTANNPGEMVFPHYESLKATASVLRLRAIAELDNQQSQSALADVRLILYLADSIRHEPVRWSLRSRLEIVNYAIQPIWEGLARRQWSDDQLVVMERKLAGFDATRDYSLVLRSELAWQLKSIEHLRTDRRAISIDCMCGKPIFWPTLACRLSPSGWFHLSKVAVARCYQAALPTSAELSLRILSPSITRRFEEAAGLERSRYWNQGSWMLSFFVPLLEREANTCARTQTSVDLARVACALERFRQASGAFPESLHALVPKYLLEIPHDVVTGQPLHYRRTEDGDFLLYSVGWNEVDDGGEPEPLRYFYVGISSPAGDWVWGYPAH